MLGAYMDDLGLQPEHLELALSRIQPSVRSAALQVYTKSLEATAGARTIRRRLRSFQSIDAL